MPGPVLGHPKPLQQHRGPSRGHSGNLHRGPQQEAAADAPVSVGSRRMLLQAATTSRFSGGKVAPRNALAPEISGPAPCP